MWIAWALALPALIAIVGKLVRPDRPMLVSGPRRRCSCWSRMLLSAVVLTNLAFKSYWGPAAAGGGDRSSTAPWQFVPWWDPRGALRAQLLVLLRRRRHRVLDATRPPH